MYTVDINCDEPIMLVNKQIGPSYNEDGSIDYSIPYIDGARFQEELLYLDTLGKKRIQVWINSPGGNVMEAMNMFSACLKSKTPVDTYNVGIAASSAGLLFMAGRRRYMCDYAQLMMHNPYILDAEDNSGSASIAFKNSCKKMLSAKSDLSEEMISTLMDNETWLGLSDCLKHGFATDAELTINVNAKYMPKMDNISNAYNYYNSIIDKIINKNKNMEFKTITNMLGLKEGSSAEVIANSINSLQNVKNQLEDKVTDLQSKLDAAKQEATDAETKVTDLQSQLDAANAEKNAIELNAKKTEATAMVNQFKNKIGSNEKAFEKFVNDAINDFDGTKELLESLPLNGKAPAAEQHQNQVKKTYNVANMMQEISSKTK